MSLRRFLNVAHAVLVEGYLNTGKDLISALEAVAELGEVTTERERPRPKPRAVVASNEASMNMLQGMLGGVQDGPKPRLRK